ncbi:MAG: thermonuclease family protein [Rhodospirillaceae bacterium]|nr:thermonuclease family protein [Rhodospirillaceae bacterium]MDE0253450.1 thermonuclease family protein [Rhodospirillaceae bacterium]MDE0617531.1 thermonuclease family protein [Rhodospirillaceae bacterium]
MTHYPTIWIAAATALALLVAGTAAVAGPVKKSKSGLCHCPGGQYYGRTKSFTAYPTIEACLDSGGRHPKRGQGDCGRAAPVKPKKQDSGADTRALDGDTLVLNGVTVRLQGIDAPESGQSCRNAQDRSYPCRAIATAALRLMIAAGDIRGDFEPEPGRYGRRIGYRYASDGTDINRWRVGQGFAVAYREYSKRYVEVEAKAKKAKIGLWQGPFVMPWEWRRGERLAKPDE